MINTAFRVFAAPACCVLLISCGGGGGGSGNNNRAPTATAVTLGVTEDTAATGNFIGSDPDGDPLTATVVSAPTKGDVVVSTTSPLSFTYTPRANQTGADSFTYTLRDAAAASAAATVTVNIAAVNDAPAITSTLSTNEGEAVAATLATDVDGDTLTLTIITPPAHGTLTLDGTTPGRVTYMPAAQFSGTDSMQLRAQDMSSGETTQTVAITVNGVNDAPAAAEDRVFTPAGVAARFVPLANDVDPDGDALTVSIVTPPGSGTATVNPDGSLQYTPAGGFSGFTTLTYEIRDPAGLSSRSSISIGIGQAWGVLYLSAPDAISAKELYFADGVQQVKVSDVLPVGASITSVVAARTAPIAFYSTADGVTTRLFKVDLRNIGVVTEILPAGAPVTAGQFLSNDDGTRLVYRDSTANALFTLSVAGGAPVQITNPIATIGAPLFWSMDERRVLFSTANAGANRFMWADSTTPMSEAPAYDATAPDMLYRGNTDDQAFWGRSATTRVDYRMVRDGVAVNLSADTPNYQSETAAMTGDGARFFYTRSQSQSMPSNSTLYSVDVSQPSVSTVFATSSLFFGIFTASAPHVGSGKLVYTAQDRNGVSFVAHTGRVYVADLAAPAAPPTLVREFGGLARALMHAPDDSLAVVAGTDVTGNPGPEPDLYLLSLDGSNQLTQVSSGVSVQPRMVLRP